MTLARLARLDCGDSASASRDVGAEMRRTMQLHCGVFRFPDLLAEGVRKMKEIAARARTPRSTTRARSSTPRASRRWSSTT